MKQWKNGLQLIRKTKFKNKHIDIGVCLFVRLLINLTMMWAIYIWSWNYTVKAMTIGFE